MAIANIEDDGKVFQFCETSFFTAILMPTYKMFLLYSVLLATKTVQNTILIYFNLTIRMSQLNTNADVE